MDCKSLSAYRNASLTHFNGGFRHCKSATRKTSIITKNTLLSTTTHLQPRPTPALKIQQKPVRKPHIRKTIRPTKEKSTKIVSTNVPDVLRLMDALRLRIGVDVYSELVEECAEVGDLTGAEALLQHIRKSRLRLPASLLNRLLLMSVRCGRVDVAQQMFDEMIVRDISSYATMIAARFDGGEYDEALDMFLGLVGRGFCVEEGEFPLWIVDCVLKACLHTMDLELGKQVHCWLIKLGYAEDFCLGSSLISFYGNFKCLEEADYVFDQIACRDTVAWTSQIVSKCKEGSFDDAIHAFVDMGREGVKMNHFTYSSVLRACGSARSMWCGKQVHARVLKFGFLSNLYVQCGLVDMYAKQGLLIEARKMFEVVEDDKNVACWNSMIIGYLQHGLNVEAMNLMYKMRDVGLHPQESLLSEVKIACGSDT